MGCPRLESIWFGDRTATLIPRDAELYKSWPCLYVQDDRIKKIMILVKKVNLSFLLKKVESNSFLEVSYNKARTYIAPHPAVSVLKFCHQTIYFQGGDIAFHGFL